MDKEIEALEQNHTSTLTTIPHGHVPIGVNGFMGLRICLDTVYC